jgi:hypothetical protein
VADSAEPLAAVLAVAVAARAVAASAAGLELDLGGPRQESVQAGRLAMASEAVVVRAVSVVVALAAVALAAQQQQPGLAPVLVVAAERQHAAMLLVDGLVGLTVDWGWPARVGWAAGRGLAARY